MTDIAVGTAIWSDLVRQVAFSARACDAAEALPHTASLNLLRYSDRTSADEISAFAVRTPDNVNSNFAAMNSVRSRMREEGVFQ